MADTIRSVNVWFYKAVRATTTGAWPPNGTSAETHIRGKLANVQKDPYIELTDGSYIIETYEVEPADRLHLAVSAVRRDNLPLRERGGATAPLPLPADENLAE